MTSTCGVGGDVGATAVGLADVGLAVAVAEAESDCVTVVCGEAGVAAAGDEDCCCVRSALSWLSIAVKACDETPAFFNAAMLAAERL